MPTAPPRACHRCGRVACTEHTRPAWRPRRHPIARVRGRQLQARRRQLYAAQAGRCATCGRVVDLDDAIRDHVIPLAEGGADVYVNTQLLCPACDRLKTHADSARGAARARR